MAPQHIYSEHSFSASVVAEKYAIFNFSATSSKSRQLLIGFVYFCVCQVTGIQTTIYQKNRQFHPQLPQICTFENSPDQWTPISTVHEQRWNARRHPQHPLARRGWRQFSESSWCVSMPVMAGKVVRAIISISACTTGENSFVYTQINTPIGEIDPIFGFPYRQYTSTTEMTDAAPYQQYTSTAEMTDAPP